ncbi:DUF4157 domain-containing protein [Agrobacterium tumefaciens]|uniref:eCIS core domain-containing protein n=1 Tax=Agrobacterium tumefaciens TaxID=358 RepID=UPI00157327B5|nr:DUF4157 domain-containing protein [Agrobacterium tumefaciens]NTB05816.1 DUF4157 domain-containing protein [Agrobacterium tumefaciens]
MKRDIDPGTISYVPNTKGSVKLYLFFVTSVIYSTSTLACGGIFDIKCNLENGGLSPGNIIKQTQKAGGDVANAAQKAGQDVANALNELQANVLSGPALEQAIIASRNTAINGAMPIPPNIRQQLSGYASEDSMNRVRYKIGDNGFVNLARLLEQGGLASAVTLIDVIVFRGPSEAADPALWAHELTHVDQYRDGTHSFAVRYTRNWQTIENPAYEKGNNFANWQASNGSTNAARMTNRAGRGNMNNGGGWGNINTQNQPPMMQVALGLQSGTGMVACGCYGFGPTVAAEPRCASGAVRAQMCPGMCPGPAGPYAPYGYVCH